MVIVTGPEQRYRHLRTEVTAAGGAPFFLFTRAERVTVEAVLTGNIWQLSHRDQLFSLETYETDAFQTELRESVQGLKTPSLL